MLEADCHFSEEKIIILYCKGNDNGKSVTQVHINTDAGGWGFYGKVQFQINRSCKKYMPYSLCC